MQYRFKGDDLVTCRITRNTVLGGQRVTVGTLVRVIGTTARMGMASSLPFLELVGDGDPEPYRNVPMEMILETPKADFQPDEVVNRDPEPAPKPRRKRKAT